MNKLNESCLKCELFAKDIIVQMSPLRYGGEEGWEKGKKKNFGSNFKGELYTIKYWEF